MNTYLKIYISIVQKTSFYFQLVEKKFVKNI